MRSRGFASGPFQMFIAVIVMAMSLTIGFYLMNTVNCWKCTETAEVESTNFREAISNVGRSDQGTMKKVEVNVPSCVDGYYLKHVSPSSGLNCKYFCPEHPNQCWVLSWNSDCSGEQSIECIDIPGDIDISYSDTNIIFTTSSSPGEVTLTSEADVFAQSTYFLGIYKKNPTEIEIGWA